MPVTILLVDANQINRALYKELFEAQGYRVATAPDGWHALKECARIQPDLVLLDISLPDFHGYEVCRQLKADPRNRLTPIVLFSASASTPDPTLSHEVGADGFLHGSAEHADPLRMIRPLLALKSYIDAQGESVVLSLARSIEARDPYTLGHCERLSELTVRMGGRLGLSGEEIEALRIAGIVHDVGKVAVSDAILLKPGELTAEEMEAVKVHPVVGEQICAPLRCFRRVLPIIRHHHERLDGSGYPDGLRGKQIPFLARILQTVDIFDALTTSRPYRKALSVKQALSELREECRRGWRDIVLVRDLDQEVCQKVKQSDREPSSDGNLIEVKPLEPIRVDPRHGARRLAQKPERGADKA